MCKANIRHKEPVTRLFSEMFRAWKCITAECIVMNTVKMFNVMPFSSLKTVFDSKNSYRCFRVRSFGTEEN